MSLLLGVDLGTTNVKAHLYTEDGELIGKGQGRYPLFHPREGWSEQSPLDWWKATVLAIREAISNKGEEVRCVAVSSQAPSLTPVNAELMPLHNGVIWMDARASEQCEKLRELIGAEEYCTINGAEPDPYYLLPKLKWFEEREPKLFQKTKYILTTNGYINARLTGCVGIDRPQAMQLSHCFDAATQGWSRLVAEKTGLPLERLLPPVMEPWDIVGRVSAIAARETGLKAGTRVACGTADAFAAQLEAGLTRPGEMSLTLGTSSMLLYAAAHQPPKGSPLMSAPQPFGFKEAPFVLSASVNTAGAAVEWLSGILGKDLCASAEMEKAAREIAPGSHGVMFLPYLSGERAPLWNRSLTGAFLGLTIQTGRAHLYRALLEGVALAALHATKTAETAGVSVERVRVSGGGARNRLWLEIHASVLGMPIQVDRRCGGAPRGDAILACYAAKCCNTIKEALERFSDAPERIEPKPQWIKRYEELSLLFQEARTSLTNPMNQMHLLTAKWGDRA